MKKTILEQLKPDNIPIQKQIDLLAQYLMEEFEYDMGNKGKGEGAIEMAVRLLEEYRNAHPIKCQKKSKRDKSIK